MAYEYLTMLDIARINCGEAALGVIEENLNIAPELEVFPARVTLKRAFSALIRTTLPTGGFRKVNEGVEPTKSKYDLREFSMYYYDAQMELDVAAAQADDQGESHAQALEASGHGETFVQTIGKQIWYGTGTGGDDDGFKGAVQLVDASYVVDAGGTTATTGSSVYMVALGPKYGEILFGNGGVISIGEWRKQSITRSSKEMTAWKNSMEGWIGIAWYSKYAIARIKKLTEDSGKTLTDSLLSQLRRKLPAAFRPTHIFMTPRSCSQLQTSRTPTTLLGLNGTSGSVLAPRPKDFEGIPIVETDSILNTEALTL